MTGHWVLVAGGEMLEVVLYWIVLAVAGSGDTNLSQTFFGVVVVTEIPTEDCQSL